MSRHSPALIPEEPMYDYDEENRIEDFNSLAGCVKSCGKILLVIVLCVAGYYLWKYF